ncbi:hypothetical protein OG21DRAFT_558091 [Imleria badia]|nr:hypothetical protein OG21DRAFT_558091 [Imleria badia]
MSFCFICFLRGLHPSCRINLEQQHSLPLELKNELADSRKRLLDPIMVLLTRVFLQFRHIVDNVSHTASLRYWDLNRYSHLCWRFSFIPWVFLSPSTFVSSRIILPYRDFSMLCPCSVYSAWPASSLALGCNPLPVQPSLLCCVAYRSSQFSSVMECSMPNTPRVW